MSTETEAPAIVEELIRGGAPSGVAGFTPVGSRTAPKLDASAGLPTSIDELPYQISHVYDLSVTAAGQLSVPVIGSVAGGYNRRVVVLERAAYKKVPQVEGNGLYGYAIRLAVTINKWDADTKLTLPFLAASAEVGLIEAKWILQVVGLAGGELDRISITPTELNVETFVLAKQSLTNLIGAVRHADTKFLPVMIGLEQTQAQQERGYLQAVGTAYAFGCLERRWELQRARDELGAAYEEVKDTVADVYEKFAGIRSPSERPSENVQRKARDLLGEVKVEPR